MLKIQSVNQQKVLDGSKQLKSLGAATLFLKLTKAFRLQTNVTSPFWSEMLVQVQDLPPNRAKLSLYSYLSSYIWKQMAEPCLESKKTLALEPQRSLFLWLRPKIAHFNQGTKQGTFIACKALTWNTSKNQAFVLKRWKQEVSMPMLQSNTLGRRKEHTWHFSHDSLLNSAVLRKSWAKFGAPFSLLLLDSFDFNLAKSELGLTHISVNFQHFKLDTPHV